jgi:hypothetical protein
MQLDLALQFNDSLICEVETLCQDCRDVHGRNALSAGAHARAEAWHAPARGIGKLYHRTGKAKEASPTANSR